jgi:hypothetical protein
VTNLNLELPTLPKRSALQQIKIDLVLEAYAKYKTIPEILAYLGIIEDTLHIWINKYQELDHLRTWQKRKRKPSNNPYWDDNPSWHRKV